jgi:hypothetical protein
VLRAFRQQVIDECRKQGYLCTIGGRRRLFPNISSSSSEIRTHTERQAVNFVIQGVMYTDFLLNLTYLKLSFIYLNPLLIHMLHYYLFMTVHVLMLMLCIGNKSKLNSAKFWDCLLPCSSESSFCLLSKHVKIIIISMHNYDTTVYGLQLGDEELASGTEGKGGVIPLVIFLPRGYVTHITELY